MLRASALTIVVISLLLITVHTLLAISVNNAKYSSNLITNKVEKSIRNIVKALINKLKLNQIESSSTSNIRINWITYINPSPGYDFAFSSCLWGNYLYVVGTANGTGYIALLDKNTGTVIKSWISPPGEVLLFKSCSVAGNMLIVVGVNYYGHPVIYVFDKYLNLLTRYVDNDVVVSEPLLISAISDGRYLYLAYWANGSFLLEYELYVEKRPLYDLGFKRSTVICSEPVPGKVGPVAINVNPVNHQIWVVTWYNFTGLEYDMIFILTPNLYLLKSFNYSSFTFLTGTARNYVGRLVGVCFDSRGDAYVAGLLGILKFDEYGNLLNVSKDILGNLKILCANDRIYLISVISLVTKLRPVLYVLDTNFDLLGYKILTSGTGSIIFFPGRPAYDGENIYTAGINYVDDNPDTKIVVYSIYVGGTRQVIRLPDLTVKNIVIEPPNPTTNDNVYLEAYICNIGNASASNIDYIIKLDNRIVKFGTIPELEPEECTYVSTSLGRLSAGLHTVQVIVDPFNKIRESNENNNVATKLFYVRELYIGCKIVIDNATVMVNSSKIINVWLINCSIATGINLELNYDPHIINVINITPGTFLKAVNGFFSKSIDNALGRISIAVAGTRPCDREKVLLARIVVLGVNEGTTRFTKVKARVADIEGNVYDVKIEGGLIRVIHVLECDFNGNGRLDIGDAILGLRILVGTYRSNVPCDLNHNGKLDIGDIILLLKKIIG